MNDGKLPSELVDNDEDWSLSDQFVMSKPGVDQDKIRQAVHLILEAIGEDPNREGLKKTPERVARMYQEIFWGLQQDPKEVLQTRFHVDHNELVLVKDISFYSACEHHLLPFFGVAHVAYLPSQGQVTGLSKLARLVEGYARRPQVQERLTNQIADTLQDELQPGGTFVMMEAEHLCMAMRGIKKPGSRTVTMATRGAFQTPSELTSQVLSFLR